MTRAIDGWNSFMGLAEEAAWATQVLPSTHWLALISSTLQEDAEVKKVAHAGFVSGQVFHNTRDFVVPMKTCGGEITFVPHYDLKSTALVFKHAFGALATSGSGPYTHALTLDTDGPSGAPGLTAQAIYGSHASLNPAEAFPGIRVNTFEFALGSADYATCKIGVIGQKSAGSMIAISGSPSIVPGEEMLSSHGSDLTFNSVTYRINKFACGFDRKLVRRPFVGSVYTDEPQPSDSADVWCRFSLDWHSHGLFDAFMAGTQAAGQLVLTGTGNNRLTISMQNMLISKVRRPHAGSGYRTMDVEAMLFGGVAGTTQGLAFDLRNDNSNAIT